MYSPNDKSGTPQLNDASFSDIALQFLHGKANHNAGNRTQSCNLSVRAKQKGCTVPN